MWTPNPILRPVHELQGDIERTVLGATRILRRILGAEDELLHVGTTALLPLLTRGTVDILVLTNRASIGTVREAIADRTTWPELPLPVSIQVEDKRALHESLQLRHILASDPMLMGEFRALQEQYAHTPGRQYAIAKEQFFADVLARPSERGASLPKGNQTSFRIEICTKRLRLETPLSLDGEAYARYRRDNQAFHQNFGSRTSSHLTSKFWQARFAEEFMSRLQRKALTFLMREPESNEIVGSCHFSGFLWRRYQHCAVGFTVAEASAGNGLMTEGVQAAIDYVHDQWGVHRVEAYYEAENTKSHRLLERLGFQVEGVLVSYLLREGTWRDCTLAARHR